MALSARSRLTYPSAYPGPALPGRGEGVRCSCMVLSARSRLTYPSAYPGPALPGRGEGVRRSSPLAILPHPAPFWRITCLKTQRYLPKLLKHLLSLANTCQNNASCLLNFAKCAIVVDMFERGNDMQTDELISLVRDVQKLKTEKQTIELKACRQGVPGKIYDTLSSFSNQDEGGIIIFGISEPDGFEVSGVYNAEETQKRIMENCNQMEPKVRALITICEIDGKTVVAAEIPGIEAALRPVFYVGAGRIKGSFVRVGDADLPMTEYEVYSYEAFRKRIRDDIRVVEDARVDLLDGNRINEYLTLVKDERRNLAKNVADSTILELMAVTCRNKPTLAGVMSFSPYPQTYFPQLCITAVVVPSTEIGDLGAEGERFIDNKRITGPIPDMLEEAVEFVRRNCRTKTIIDDSGNRKDKTEYPIKAVREAILNALVHRDYSLHTENIPVTIEMYRDRMEIKNPGGLYGTNSLDRLGKMHPETRNAALANILEILKITENRYSGIPTIYKEFKEALLPEPIFAVNRGEFHVIFRNNIAVSETKIDKADITAGILQFCSIPRTRQELIEFTGKSRYYTMSALIQPLVECGKLKMTYPEKPKSVKQKYYAEQG